VKADSHCARQNEIHFKDFLFLVVYDCLFWMVGESPWFQSIGYVQQEFAITVLHWVEEETKVVEEVIPNVMYHNSPLYLTRQRCNEAVVLFYRGQSVIRPVVFEV